MRVETFKILEWEEEGTGLIINENDTWDTGKTYSSRFYLLITNAKS